MKLMAASEKLACGGLKLRKQTEGPEIEMVRGFLEDSPIFGEILASSFETALFIEPRIDSGFPDLVVVSYEASLLESWEPLRNTLSVPDLKIYSDVINHRPSKSETISRRTGFTKKQVELSLELLQACNLVCAANKTWKCVASRPLGLKDIVSIEAKTSSVSVAVRQAMMNKRFATESYILVQSNRASSQSVERCELLGLGILSDRGNSLQLKARAYTLPINHVTLQFNEWVAGYLNEGVH